MKELKSAEQDALRRRFGSERDVEAITGFSAKTLQKDRLLGRRRFPWYKCGGKVLYDLDEVEAIIRASAGGAAA
jgi:hypothetical protein